MGIANHAIAAGLLYGTLSSRVLLVFTVAGAVAGRLLRRRYPPSASQLFPPGFLRVSSRRTFDRRAKNTGLQRNKELGSLEVIAPSPWAVGHRRRTGVTCARERGNLDASGLEARSTLSQAISSAGGRVGDSLPVVCFVSFLLPNGAICVAPE